LLPSLCGLLGWIGGGIVPVAATSAPDHLNKVVWVR
jgi:hypothetical protein